MTRGINQQVELWKKFMETQMFSWKRKALKNMVLSDGRKIKKGEEFSVPVQGALRPIQLWEYVFPEECLPEVLAMLNVPASGHREELPKPAEFALRKILKAKKIKPYTPPAQKRFIADAGVGVYLIGTKEDVKQKWEELGVEQEML